MKISFVIVTCNRAPYIQRCLESIARYSSGPATESSERPEVETEVTIVDNSPNSDTRTVVLEFLKNSQTPSIQYLMVKPHESVLSLGRNLGAELSTGDVVAFIDDDTELHPEWISACVRSFSDMSVGAVGGRIIEPGDAEKESSADLPIGRLLANGKMTANFYLNPKKTILIDHIRGCNWAIRRALFRSLGGFSSRMHHVFEETELCFRLKKNNIKLVFDPQMSLDHNCGPRVHHLRKRDPKLATLQQRENVSAHVRLLAICFGLLSSYTLRYVFTADTGILGFLRSPTRKELSETLNVWRGKFLGISRYIFEREAPQGHLEILEEFGRDISKPLPQVAREA